MARGTLGLVVSIRRFPYPLRFTDPATRKSLSASEIALGKMPELRNSATLGWLWRPRSPRTAEHMAIARSVPNAPFLFATKESRFLKQNNLAWQRQAPLHPWTQNAGWHRGAGRGLAVLKSVVGRFFKKKGQVLPTPATPFKFQPNDQVSFA